MIRFTSTVFVDAQFGNDSTGQLDSQNFPFKTFDAAYIATTTRSEPYSILLASGSYDARLDTYENISVEETNGFSNSFVRIHENVSNWNGVRWNDVILIICVGDNFRKSINIIGASSIESSATVFIDDPLPNNTYQKDINKYIKKQKDNKKRKNKKIKNIDINENIEAIFVSRRAFKLLAPVFINKNIELFYTILDNFGLAQISMPNIEDDKAVAMFITTVTRVLATTLFDDSGNPNYSSLWYSLDPSIINPILSLLESDESLINKNPRVLMKNTNVNINVPTSTENILFGVSSIRLPEYVNRENNMEENEIARMIELEVENSVNSAIMQTKNRTNDDPDISIINSNITYRNLSKDTNMGMQLTSNNLNYYAADSNISNVTLLDIDGSNIDVKSTEGSDIKNGSKFVRYRCISDNYTHERLDGSIFFIDASKNDITVIIPDFVEEGILWDGRIIQYVRIDDTCNMVIIKNEAGLIENKKDTVRLCNKGWKNAEIELLLRNDGSAYVLG